jgi:hypothetical protein
MPDLYGGILAFLSFHQWQMDGFNKPQEMYSLM